jgi:hypothetical protein
MQISHFPHGPAIIHFVLDYVFTGSSNSATLDQEAFAKSHLNGFLQMTTGVL